MVVVAVFNDKLFETKYKKFRLPKQGLVKRIYPLRRPTDDEAHNVYHKLNNQYRKIEIKFIVKYENTT